MPWEAILGGATGAVAIAIVVGVLFRKSLTDKVVEAAEKRFEAAEEDRYLASMAARSRADVSRLAHSDGRLAQVVL